MLALAGDQQHHLEQLLETLLASWPRTLDHSCQICRLCDLSACPADRCPVEQRYLHFGAQETQISRPRRTWQWSRQTEGR
jgi:hypothetical protein